MSALVLASLATTSACKRTDPTKEPAPSPAVAATIELPEQVRGLADLAGVTVGEPGFEGGMPVCCLDCDPLVPPLRRVEALVPSLTGAVGPAPLRQAAAEVRGVAWAELIEDMYQPEARQAFVAGLGGLADAFDATAAALEANDGSSKARADALAGAVTTLLAAAADVGEESQGYCGND